MEAKGDGKGFGLLTPCDWVEESRG
ncbi:hypothetical protein CBM2599_B50444 [Cupriavidus taiwanensis]|nr:hypothetical protein CBM2600_B10545 [Cupriavidus taiwanensis]SOY96512.1 hypothetical protein CBM2599_B50444 [Cupriavidus taiwanensis]